MLHAHVFPSPESVWHSPFPLYPPIAPLPSW
ncbi:unnamed protein product [Acanthoscelides obtectus]|uniref:Uncharacterized protein n=1 Tax=Acanthoscelides obtectus TaxID=200917 RepID=A0A9P0P2U1_ACAOB|nr:unnamed protein product [Acanthoscelides obtectus]CAK1683733.1 hypothetical protein AOBTE_LOCUS34431 [Acanthoscelides obtectus]